MKKLSTLLIANRGEIACRIIHTARRMGLRTVAVHAAAEANALHVRMADSAIDLGGASAADSYLNIQKILDAARTSKADAIHPGYGFLSERAEFAEACAKAGVIFVGPPASAIRAMGLKSEAKARMEKAGVPVVPGYHGDNQETDILKAQVRTIGYPVLIKAVAGGGGKGMRRVDSEAEFTEALAGAQREAQSAFGDPRVLIEKYIQAPRHIEMQVFADTHGNIVHLFERDCSLQRRYQKVIEESPAPGMTTEMRDAMGRAAIAAARAVNYVGAGTVEFIVDGAKPLSADNFYFMEMNTRLQVEHPVTEAVTGLDLVEWQLRVAQGEALPRQQADLSLNGHAIEARLYAEDVDAGFLPSAGTLHYFGMPQAVHFQANTCGLRIDSGVTAGDAISPFYDPMIAKLIVHDTTRARALLHLSQALARVRVAGPCTNAAFLKRLVDHPFFAAGAFDTGFIAAHAATLGTADDSNACAPAAAHYLDQQERSSVPQADAQGWTSPWAQNGERVLPRSVAVNGHVVERVLPRPDATYSFIRTAAGLFLFKDGACFCISPPDYDALLSNAAQTDGALIAPMTGKVVALGASLGAPVKRGDKLVTIEAMKMEHSVFAPCDGTLRALHVQAGAQVERGSVVAEITADITA